MTSHEQEQNVFYGSIVQARVTRVSDLASDREMQLLLLWIARKIVPLGAADRRELSTHCYIDGIDCGNASYNIFWYLMMDWAPRDNALVVKAQRWENSNSCDNLIEPTLGCLSLINEMRDYHAGPGRFRPHADLSGGVQGLVQRLATTGCPIMTAPRRFLPKLREGVRLVWQCLYWEPTKSLFASLNSDSEVSQLKHAAADIEAIRLGWPGAEWSEPGYRPALRDWLCYPIHFFPERKRQLQRLIPPMNPEKSLAI